MAEDSITYRRTLEQIAVSGTTNRDLAGWAAKIFAEAPPIPNRTSGARSVTLDAV
jgi:hypothetical protein